MLEFSTRGGLDGGRDFTAWTSIADDPTCCAPSSPRCSWPS
jgi:hypothetical protein